MLNNKQRAAVECIRKAAELVQSGFHEFTCTAILAVAQSDDFWNTIGSGVDNLRASYRSFACYVSDGQLPEWWNHPAYYSLAQDHEKLHQEWQSARVEMLNNFANHMEKAYAESNQALVP